MSSTTVLIVKCGDYRWWDRAQEHLVSVHKTKNGYRAKGPGFMYDFDIFDRCVTQFGNPFYRVELIRRPGGRNVFTSRSVAIKRTKCLR